MKPEFEVVLKNRASIRKDFLQQYDTVISFNVGKYNAKTGENLKIGDACISEFHSV